MATLHFSASGNGLLVNITTGNQTLKVGDTDVKMTCRVNKGLLLLYNNHVQWLHVSNATGSSTETLLTTNTQTKANRSEYSVVFQYAGQHSTITLNLKTGQRQHCLFTPLFSSLLLSFAPSLALDPTFRIYSHKTFDTAQPCHLLKPNWKPSSSHSVFIPTNISTQFLLQLCVCVCV